MSKFIPWVSDGNVIENTNVYDYSNFSGVNSQSKNGFQSGNIISSTYMNSALRQANLVIAALMECTGNNTLDLTSSVNDVKSVLQTYFTGLYVARATSDSDGNNIKNTYAKQNGTYNTMTVGNATNADFATNNSNYMSINNRLSRLEHYDNYETGITNLSDFYNRVINLINEQTQDLAESYADRINHIAISIASDNVTYTEYGFTIPTDGSNPYQYNRTGHINDLSSWEKNPSILGEILIDTEGGSSIYNPNNFIVRNYFMNGGKLCSVTYNFYGENKGHNSTSHVFSELGIHIEDYNPISGSFNEKVIGITRDTIADSYTFRARICYKEAK